jgi:hypothetical protein
MNTRELKGMHMTTENDTRPDIEEHKLLLLLTRAGLALSDFPMSDHEFHRKAHDRIRGRARGELLARLRDRGLVEAAA